MTLPTKESLEGWRVEQKMAYLRILDATNIIFESAVHAIKQRDEALKTIKDLESAINRYLVAKNVVWREGVGVVQWLNEASERIEHEASFLQFSACR